MAKRSLNDRTQARPGAVIKSVRARHGWTLAQVSERTGLPIPTLSKVENDKMGLTFEKLLRISEGLGIDISELFAPPASIEVTRGDGSARRSVTRAGDGQRIDTSWGTYLYPAAELLNKLIIPIVGEVRPKSLQEFGAFSRHPGEEFVYVLEGILDLHTERYTPVRLNPGDSSYFDSSMGHAYVAVGNQRCRILSICAPSGSAHPGLDGKLETEVIARPAMVQMQASRDEGTGRSASKGSARRRGNKK